MSKRLFKIGLNYTATGPITITKEKNMFNVLDSDGAWLLTCPTYDIEYMNELIESLNEHFNYLDYATDDPQWLSGGSVWSDNKQDIYDTIESEYSRWYEVYQTREDLIKAIDSNMNRIGNTYFNLAWFDQI